MRPASDVPRPPASGQPPGAAELEPSPVAAAISAVFREEVGRITGALVRQLGDFDLAEDIVQDAVLRALEVWPAEGIPNRPGAWLLTTARRRGIDRLRRDLRFRDKLILLQRGADPAMARGGEIDERLRLIFTCCHPSLARDAQVALTLRAVAGMTTAEIARAFLVPEVTMAQRIVRAKRKIVDAAIPYRAPQDDELAARLEEVLAVLYLVFNEGFLASGPEVAARQELVTDAEWLTRLLARLLPDQSEVLGLLALIRLQRARSRARFDSRGEMVLLQYQDRALWDRGLIADTVELIERARQLGAPGPYWVQAAITACHAEAPSWEDTDWAQILALYGALLRLSPNPVVRLNQAIALRHVAGPAAALEQVEALAAELDRYHLYHATRADLLRAFGRDLEARDADLRALALTANPAERALILRRLADSPAGG